MTAPVLFQLAVPELACPRLKMPALTLMVPWLVSEAVCQVLLVAALSVPLRMMGSAA